MTSKFTVCLIITAVAGRSIAGVDAADQKTFRTPDAAAQALVAAAQKETRAEVIAIIGEELRGAVSTGSPAQDQVEKAVILRLAKESTIAKVDAKNPDRATVYLGKNEWPFPVPLVRTGSRWRFDSKAGLEEIEDRKIAGHFVRRGQAVGVGAHRTRGASARRRAGAIALAGLAFALTERRTCEAN